MDSRGRKGPCARLDVLAALTESDLRARYDRGHCTRTIAGSSPPSPTSSTASVSALIHSSCSSRSASPAGIVRRMRSVSSSAGFLAHRVHEVGQLVDTRLSGELVVERRVERHRDADVGRHRPAAFTASPLDEHLVRRELVARGAEPTVVELLEVARPASAARTAASSLPSRGPSSGRFGLTRSSASTVAELDLLHAQLVARSRRRAAAIAGAPSTTRRRSGWRTLSEAGLPRLVAEPDDDAHLRHARRAARASGVGVDGPAGEVDGRRRRPRTARVSTRHRWSARNGITGAITRRPGDERVPQRARAPPRRRPRSVGASDGCTSSRRRRRSSRTPA